MSNNLSIDYVKDMIKKIEDAKIQKATINGRIENILDTLKKDFNISDYNEGLAVLKELEADINDLQLKIDEKTKRLKEKYNI